jgi:group I intron endonuclease
MGYIYLVENTINNKKYIGQTIRKDIKTRWKYHKTLNSKRYIGQILFNAYKKYGKENFTYKIICICFDDDTNKYEKEFIKKYNTIYPNGYNLLEGGNNNKHSEFTKKILSEKNSGKNHPQYGETPSPETINKIKLSNINYYKNKNKIKKDNLLNKGRVQKEETKEKISKNRINNIIKNSKIRIHQYDLKMNLINTFISYSEASRKCDISRHSIKKSCISKKSSKYFFWIKEDI